MGFPLLPSIVPTAPGLWLLPLCVTPRPMTLLEEAATVPRAAAPLCARTPTSPHLHPVTPPMPLPDWGYSPLTPPPPCSLSQLLHWSSTHCSAVCQTIPSSLLFYHSLPLLPQSYHCGHPHCRHQDLFPAGQLNCILMLKLPHAS